MSKAGPLEAFESLVRQSSFHYLCRPGFTAGGSERLRDAGDVPEEAFDAYWADRLASLPPRATAGGVTVECAGWACGRGSAWASWRAAKQQKAITSFFAPPKPPNGSSASAAGTAAAAAALPKGVEKVRRPASAAHAHRGAATAVAAVEMRGGDI